MSTTTPRQPEQPLQRSQTADSSLSRRRKKSADRRQATPRESFAPQTRPTSLHRYNKLYRGPPTPPPEVQYDRERSFILDAKAVSNISNDYSVANPKLGSVIPPYNAQLDSHVDNYFKFFSIRKTLEKTGQAAGHESTAGQVHDRFFTNGHGYRYLSLRNKFGSGHSVEEIRGHELFLSDPKPIVNYNGLFGYRRNTPSLRHQPTIGTKKIDTYNYTRLGRYSIIGCGKTYTFHCRCKFDQPCRCHNQDKLCPCVKA
ncbi:unnamed protein product [Rotaria socialis]|uniref:Uncharacterized protein n=3 Tax=Rotaria socialis TaxID=392032 RepID=A0A818WS58_9BILA|nr:unnamed protein product [Rotaria socialis]CAF3553909.1 unnamed protein product [Rotaria socialis]CAF3623520.1 unnamed protein product [Rotaria socialis]CAF3730343.1 unnamed protein product [Rotaria socialis]CAF4458966.1 unnamed protein product [Rotaria socialis]